MKEKNVFNDEISVTSISEPNVIYLTTADLDRTKYSFFHYKTIFLVGAWFYSMC